MFVRLTWGTVLSRRRVFDYAVAGHESKCAECSRVVCTYIPSVASMTVNIPQSERDTKLGFQKNVLARTGQSFVASRLHGAEAPVSSTL